MKRYSLTVSTEGPGWDCSRILLPICVFRERVMRETLVPDAVCHKRVMLVGRQSTRLHPTNTGQDGRSSRSVCLGSRSLETLKNEEKTEVQQLGEQLLHSPLQMAN